MDPRRVLFFSIKCRSCSRHAIVCIHLSICLDGCLSVNIYHWYHMRLCATKPDFGFPTKRDSSQSPQLKWLAGKFLLLASLDMTLFLNWITKVLLLPLLFAPPPPNICKRNSTDSLIDLFETGVLILCPFFIKISLENYFCGSSLALTSTEPCGFTLFGFMSGSIRKYWPVLSHLVLLFYGTPESIDQFWDMQFYFFMVLCPEASECIGQWAMQFYVFMFLCPEASECIGQFWAMRFYVFFMVLCPETPESSPKVGVTSR